MNKVFVAVGVFIGIAILILGSYFLVFKDGENLASQKGKLESALILAQDKLGKAKDVLARMTERLNSYFYFGSEMQDQIENITQIVEQTDFLFTNPYGETPEFIIEGFADGEFISEERRQINALLEKWRKKSGVSSIGSISIEDGRELMQDTEKIKAFLENLYTAVGNLTPENSGLSQAQIDTYVVNLPSVAKVDEVIASISTAINTANNSGTTNGGEGPINPEEVLAQEELVEEYEEEVENIQENITQVQTQIEQTTPPAPVPAPVVTTPPPASNSSGASPVPSYGKYGSRVIVPTTGIVVQPGPAILIQGVDDR